MATIEAAAGIARQRSAAGKERRAHGGRRERISGRTRNECRPGYRRVRRLDTEMSPHDERKGVRAGWSGGLPIAWQDYMQPKIARARWASKRDYLRNILAVAYCALMHYRRRVTTLYVYQSARGRFPGTYLHSHVYTSCMTSTFCALGHSKLLLICSVRHLGPVTAILERYFYRQFMNKCCSSVAVAVIIKLFFSQMSRWSFRIQKSSA